MNLSRRRFLQGTAALFAAPAIVRAELIMPVAPVIWQPPKWQFDIYTIRETAAARKDEMILRVPGMDNGVPGIPQAQQDARIFKKQLMYTGPSRASSISQLQAEQIYQEMRKARELMRDYHYTLGNPNWREDALRDAQVLLTAHYRKQGMAV